MKVQLTSGKITVEDVSAENLEQVLDVLENRQVSIQDDAAEQSTPPEGPTAEQLARAREKIVGVCGYYDDELIDALLEDETVEVEQILAIIPDWEERLIRIETLKGAGWMPTPEEERELRHAAVKIVNHGCLLESGEPLGRSQLVIVGIYACDDHRAHELFEVLDPCYNARVEAEEREAVENNFEVLDEFLEDNDEARERRLVNLIPDEFAEDTEHLHEF